MAATIKRKPHVSDGECKVTVEMVGGQLLSQTFLEKQVYLGKSGFLLGNKGLGKIKSGSLARVALR